MHNSARTAGGWIFEFLVLLKNQQQILALITLDWILDHTKGEKSIQLL